MYDFYFPCAALTSFSMLRQGWIAMNKAIEAKLAKIGLTPEQLAVLWACRDYPGTLIPAEVARLLFRENQTIAGLLNRMERDGLIKRNAKRKGQPFTEIKITPKGEQIVEPGIAILKELVTEFGSDLSDGQHEQLQSLIRIMRDKALEKLYIEPAVPIGVRTGEPVAVNW
ncbi:MAG: MarR family transcriptional regulator [Dehalococcoidia bacterium]|nr:MarR family transcriptional regulator [Dehalococcoidia bacterium]